LFILTASNFFIVQIHLVGLQGDHIHQQRNTPCTVFPLWRLKKNRRRLNEHAYIRVYTQIMLNQQIRGVCGHFGTSIYRDKTKSSISGLAFIFIGTRNTNEAYDDIICVWYLNESEWYYVVCCMLPHCRMFNQLQHIRVRLSTECMVELV
jgi:hypothetical protein